MYSDILSGLVFGSVEVTEGRREGLYRESHLREEVQKLTFKNRRSNARMTVS